MAELLALFVEFVRWNPKIAADDPAIQRVFMAYFGLLDLECLTDDLPEEGLVYL